jgi:hypothetical protein
MESEVFRDWPGRIVSVVKMVVVALVKWKARQNKSGREAIRGEIIKGLIFV